MSQGGGNRGCPSSVLIPGYDMYRLERKYNNISYVPAVL